MQKVNLVKSHRKNAAVSTVTIFDNDQVMANDSSDRNWRTNSMHSTNIERAFMWMMTRGYKYIIFYDGSYKHISQWREEVEVCTASS